MNKKGMTPNQAMTILEMAFRVEEEEEAQEGSAEEESVAKISTKYF